jgi:secreted trypsin-like serine protease
MQTFKDLLMRYSFFLTLLMTLATSPARALIGGVEQNVNNGIFNIAVMEKGAEEADVCTAAKIGENVFITAAHCFDFHKLYLVAFSTASKNPKFDFDSLGIIKVIRHPSFKVNTEGGSDFSEADVAIVFTKPDPIFAKLNTLELSYEVVNFTSKVEIWGYGCQENMNKLETYYPVKKSFTTQVEDKGSLLTIGGAWSKNYFENADSIFEYNFMTPGKEKSAEEASVCFGDSGGPVLMNGKIVGINAEGIMSDIDDNGESPSGISYLNMHTRLSLIQDWIQKTLGYAP